MALWFLLLQCSGNVLYAADFKKVQIKGPRGSTAQFSGVIYGPIDSDDTLWRIADRYRQDKNYSIYQVMVAIQELNPDAFNSDNLNSMRNGATLQMPSDRYITRIDAREAQDKSEDDYSRWRNVRATQPESRNIKPPEKLASQNDLTQTKADIENKLNEIDAEQQRQFQVIRQQFAESIESVQSLLDENRKIYDRLDVVNEDIEELRSRIGDEGEVQQQMDQILAMQSELLANSRREQEEASKFDLVGLLTSPAVLIGSTVLVSLSFLVGLAMWLLRRVRKEDPEVKEMEIPEETHSAMEEMDNLSDVLSDELSGDKSGDASDDLFGDDDLLDDVLAEELDDSLDEVLESELGSFDDLDDDILVSNDSATEDEFEQAFADSPDSDDLENTEFDVFGGDDDDGIEITDSDDGLDSELAGDIDDISGDIEEIDDTALSESDSTDDAGSDFEDLDIPSGIEENQPEESESKSEIYDPEGDLNISSGDVLSDEDMEKVGDKIGETTRQLNDITKELMKDLKKAPDKGPDDPDIAIEQPEEEDDFEEFSGELTADFLSDVLSDTESGDEDSAAADTESQAQEADLSGAESAAETDSAEGAQGDLADELLAEFGIDAEAEPETPKNEQDDLADELLAEFGIEAEDSGSQDETNEPASPQEDLADEILSEFGIDADEEVAPESSQQDDIADELLAEFGIDSDELETSGEEASSNDELTAIPDNQTVDNDLADDLLAEFGIDSNDLQAGADIAESESEQESEDSDDNESADSEEDNSELDAIPDNQTVDNDLADDLLAEFGIDSEDLAAGGASDSEASSPSPEPSMEQELLAEIGMSDDEITQLNVESEELDAQPDTPEPEEESAEENAEKPREYAIDNMSEDDYQTLLSELGFDVPPTPPQDTNETSPEDSASSAVVDSPQSGNDELDDIDALLAQHAPDSDSSTEEDDGKKTDEPDDIDSLLAQHAPESELNDAEPNENNAALTANDDELPSLEIEEFDTPAESTADEQEDEEYDSGEYDPATHLSLEVEDESSLIDEIDLDDPSSEDLDTEVDSDVTQTSKETNEGAQISHQLEPESPEIDFDLDLDEDDGIGGESSDLDLTDPQGGSKEEFKLELERDDVDFELDIEDDPDGMPELAFENEVDIPNSEPELEIEIDESASISPEDSLDLAADELALELDSESMDSLDELVNERSDSELAETSSDSSVSDAFDIDIPDEFESESDSVESSSASQIDDDSRVSEDSLDEESESDNTRREEEYESSAEQTLSLEEVSGDDEESLDEKPEFDALSNESSEGLAESIDPENEAFIDDLEAAADAMMSEVDETDLDMEADNDANSGMAMVDQANAADVTELEEALDDSFSDSAEADTEMLGESSLRDEPLAELQEQLADETDSDTESAISEASIVEDSPGDDDYIDDSELDAALREFEEADFNSTLPDESASDRELLVPEVAASNATQADTAETSDSMSSELDDMPGLGDWLGETDTMSQSDVTLPQDEAEQVKDWLDSDSNTSEIENLQRDEELGIEQEDDSLPSLDDLEFSLGGEAEEGADPELEAMLSSVEDELGNDDTAAEHTAQSDLPIDEDDNESLENISFDALLDSIEEPEDVQPQDIVAPADAKLDNPDLDLGVLLDEDLSADNLSEGVSDIETGSFTDVEDLLTESIEAEGQSEAEPELNLDALLSDFSGVEGDADTLDVDTDSGNNAKLDLARAYIEINDNDAAREILDELKVSGSVEEQEEVEELLKKLH